MSRDAEFAGKVALVTGAGSGIGAACATVLARRGASVVIADIKGEAAGSVAKQLKAERLHAAEHAVDVTDPDAVARMVSFAKERFGGLDLAVNNAGISPDGALVDELAVETWRRVIDINLSGVFYCLRAEVPAMLERGAGAIVNMSSVLGSVAGTSNASYIASKHGVVGLTKAAALEYTERGIRINSVGPGYVETPMVIDSLSVLQRKAYERTQPIRRFAQPHEIATVVAFLLSDEASYISGGHYLVDGGFTAQ